VVLKNKIHHKMQREKLYNLHQTTCFIVVLFVFKMKKILSDQFSTVRKRCLLVQDKFIFSYFKFLSPDIFCLQKTKYITRCSVETSTTFKVKLILIVYFLPTEKRNSVRPIFAAPKKSCREKFFFLISYIK
jgi:hypothetical protein